MTIIRKPGIYFEEETTVTSRYDDTKIPLLIIQGATEIAALDGQATLVTDFDAFKTLTNNKGLTNTIDYIEDVILESGIGQFYVYKVATDTATTFTNIFKETANLTEIVDVAYIEETKSANTNTLTSKIGAIKNGLKDNAKNGVFRECYIIPYGTVQDAITNKAEGKTDEEAAITSLTGITEGAGNGRIIITVPDGNAGFVVGHCIGSEYNDGIDYDAFENVNTEDMLHFNAVQELVITNLGVLVLSRETMQGISQYRLYLGVTTSFKEDESDGYIRGRRVCDELLRQFKFQAEPLIKRPEPVEEEDISTILTGIIDRFANNGDISADGTALEVTDNGDQTFGVTGTITTTKPLLEIDVNTILK